MLNKKAPIFPTNYGWTTTSMHSYKPRDVNAAVKKMIAETLIKGDKKFEHVLRQCQTSWILAITVGKDVLHLRIYDPADVDGGTNKVLSTSLNLPRTHFLEINRNKDIRELSAERLERVVLTAPILYADRCLRPEEIRLCDVYKRSCQGEGYLPDDAFPIPEVSAEGPTRKVQPHWQDDTEKEDA